MAFLLLSLLGSPPLASKEQPCLLVMCSRSSSGRYCNTQPYKSSSKGVFCAVAWCVFLFPSFLPRLASCITFSFLFLFFLSLIYLCIIASFCLVLISLHHNDSSIPHIPAPPSSSLLHLHAHMLFLFHLFFLLLPLCWLFTCTDRLRSDDGVPHHVFVLNRA